MLLHSVSTGFKQYHYSKMSLGAEAGEIRAKGGHRDPNATTTATLLILLPSGPGPAALEAIGLIMRSTRLADCAVLDLQNTRTAITL